MTTTIYGVHPMTDNQGREDGRFAVVNETTGDVRCECGSQAEAEGLAAELNEETGDE